MLIQLRAWLNKRKQKRLKQSREIGFDYAAGQLMRGVTPYHLQQDYSTAEVLNENERCRAFDNGMKEAVDLAVQKGWIEDNRYFAGVSDED